MKFHYYIIPLTDKFPISEVTERKFLDSILSDLYVCGTCNQVSFCSDDTIHNFTSPVQISWDQCKKFVDERGQRLANELGVLEE